MKTPGPTIDLDLIASFIDGRATPMERERAIKMLAESDAAFEVFSDALRARADLGDGKVVPIQTAVRAHRIRSWWPALPLAAAAVLMIAVLPRMRAGREPGVVVASGALLSPLAQRPDLLRMALGGGWEQREWSVTRGGTSVLADSALAFRLGVRTVDMQVALIMNDRTVAEWISMEILRWLQPVEFSQPLAANYRDLRTQIASASRKELLVADATAAEERLGAFVDPFWYGFGRWCAAAELAARDHARPFFQADYTTRVIQKALENKKLAGEDVAALRQIDTLARQGVPDERFDTLRDVLRALIRRHAG